MSITIRDATPSDIPQIHAIYTYYVLNTTISMMLHAPTEAYMAQRFHATTAHALPYLVATTPSPSATDSPEPVLGYAHVSPFSADKAGYRAAVELTLYLAPEHIARGTGTALMNTLMERLRTTPYLSFETNGVDEHSVVTETVRVKQVYAIMSTDVVGRGDWAAKGERTREWYVRKFGFREVGRCPGIGEKFGRRVDVIYMMKELE